MKTSSLSGVIMILATAPTLAYIVPPALAQAERPGPEGVTSLLEEVLSIVSGGLVSSHGNPPRVVRDGASYRITIPLPDLTTPTNAAIEAIARPLDSGLWDVAPLTLPPTGTMPLAAGNSAGTVSFSIGQQAIHATIDPALTRPSPFAADLRDITVQSNADGKPSNQAIARYNLTGSVVGDANQHLDVQAQFSASDWRIEAHNPSGATTNGQINALAGNLNVEGLDRGQADHLTTAARALAADLRAASDSAPKPRDAPASPGARRPVRPAPEQPGDKAPLLSAALRARVRAVVDACVGLLTRLDVEETLQKIHFQTSGTNDGDIGQLRFGLSSEARNDRLNTRFEMKIDDLAIGAVPTELAAYVPRHIAIQPVISGLRIEKLIRVLRDATAAEVDPSVLQAEALALLSDPETQLGVQSLGLSSGPLHVTGSARFHADTDGTPAGVVHLVANGLDAWVAETKGNPQVQRMLPMVLMAEGMAQRHGDELVWDIVLDHGATTVNGTPLGQPPPARPPSNR